jgi:cephalosporin hydroxylase
MASDERMAELTRDWFNYSFKHRYSYHFKWMGMPIIQYPQDIIAMQELIWEIKPEFIIETGVARGGSLAFYASILKLLGGNRRVVGIDIDIRKHNRERIEAHPMFDHIELVEGSSIDDSTFEKINSIVKDSNGPIIVALDSNHTHKHVLKELELYSNFVTLGSFLVVFDTHCEFLPQDLLNDRPWGEGDNPYTAVKEFLSKDERFVRVPYEEKLQISAAPFGFLKRIK